MQAPISPWMGSTPPARYGCERFADSAPNISIIHINSLTNSRAPKRFSAFPQPPEYSTSAMKATITPIVKCERRIQLPIWRKDWRVEFLSMDVHDKAGLIVTGRKDGHVLLWNTSTGFLRKEMYGGIFNKIDEDGSGTLSHEEVISYLMTNEHWSKQEVKK